MTILPQLRDRLEHEPTILPQLHDAVTGRRRPQRRRRRAVPAVLLTTGGLLATAGALAATGVIPIGSPLPVTQVNRDPHRGPGVPVSRDSRLLPIRAADPAGGPPWGMRVVKTSRGLTCIQIGRVVDGRLGALGQDGIAGDDGRFHALPLATAASALSPCLYPDAKGQLFSAVTRPTYASGDTRTRACHARQERPQGRPPCPVQDERQAAYGMLGPQAKSITFADGSTQSVTAPDGAYLFVRAGDPDGGTTSMGGAPAIGVFGSPVQRIDYRDGTSCPPVDPKRPFCPTKGMVPRAERKSTPQLRRPLDVRVSGKRVSAGFSAPVAITGANDFYLLRGRFDSPLKACRSIVLFVPSDRDIAKGQRVRLGGPVPPRCRGRLKGEVLLSDAGYRNSRPGATVGRFTLTIP